VGGAAGVVVGATVVVGAASVVEGAADVGAGTLSAASVPWAQAAANDRATTAAA